MTGAATRCPLLHIYRSVSCTELVILDNLQTRVSNAGFLCFCVMVASPSGLEMYFKNQIREKNMFWLVCAAAALIYGIFEFGRVSTLYHLFKWGFLIALCVILVQMVLRAKAYLKSRSKSADEADVSSS